MKLALISPKSSLLSSNIDFQNFWKTNRFLSDYRKNWAGNSTNLLVLAALTPSLWEIEYIDENGKKGS